MITSVFRYENDQDLLWKCPECEVMNLSENCYESVRERICDAMILSGTGYDNDRNRLCCCP